LITKEILKEVAAKTPEALAHPNDRLEPNGHRSQIARAALSIRGHDFTLLSQNTKKASRFAQLANSGHDVAWAISAETGYWYLIVDGELTENWQVGRDGRLTP